jgi:hypothetical protein
MLDETRKGREERLNTTKEMLPEKKDKSKFRNTPHTPFSEVWLQL